MSYPDTTTAAFSWAGAASGAYPDTTAAAFAWAPSAQASGSFSPLALLSPAGSATVEVFSIGALTSSAVVAPGGSAATIPAVLASGALPTATLSPPSAAGTTQDTVEAAGVLASVELEAAAGTGVPAQLAMGGVPPTTATSPAATSGTAVFAGGSASSIALTAPRAVVSIDHPYGFGALAPIWLSPPSAQALSEVFRENETAVSVRLVCPVARVKPSFVLALSRRSPVVHRTRSAPVVESVRASPELARL